MRSETYLHVHAVRDVNAVDEPDLVRAVPHDHGARADPVAGEPDAAHQRPVGDAGRGDDDVLARREAFRAVDLLEVGHTHRAATPVLLPLTDVEARENLAIQAARRR